MLARLLSIRAVGLAGTHGLHFRERSHGREDGGKLTTAQGRGRSGGAEDAQEGPSAGVGVIRRHSRCQATGSPKEVAA